ACRWRPVRHLAGAEPGQPGQPVAAGTEARRPRQPRRPAPAAAGARPLVEPAGQPASPATDDTAGQRPCRIRQHRRGQRAHRGTHRAGRQRRAGGGRQRCAGQPRAEQISWHEQASMIASLSSRLLRWFDRHGRKDLPWQRETSPGRRDAYGVWLSEVMLQQTQVATVVGYFERFVAALPTLRDLAAADEDTVLALWSGLGYYRRARFLHQAARICVAQHGGELPCDFAALNALPGIGRSTAGAILAQAHGLRFPILDGNVKRVLTRYHGIHGDPATSAIEKQLWRHAEAHTPKQRVADYTQAIMDLGATVCMRSRPRCETCPLAADCIAHRDALTAQLPTRKV